MREKEIEEISMDPYFNTRKLRKRNNIIIKERIFCFKIHYALKTGTTDKSGNRLMN